MHGGEPAWPDDAVEVGYITGAWGIKGGIRIKPHAAQPQALFSTKRWFIKPPASAAGPKPASPATLLLHIILAREQGDGVVATARELPDRDAAEALKGASIHVSRASFPSPSKDEFYWVDLIGLEVLNRQGLNLGSVEGLLQTGPHSVLRVLQTLPGGDQLECLIPFVAAYVDEVSLEQRRITVDWLPDY